MCICSKNGPTTKYIILGLYIVYMYVLYVSYCIISYINFTRLTYIIKPHLMRIRLPNFPKHNEYVYYLSYFGILNFLAIYLSLTSFHFTLKTNVTQEREKTGKC